MNLLRNHSSSTVLTRAMVLVLTVGSALALAHPTPASSRDLSDVVVSYQDLDLSRPADVQALYHRLQHASSSVCGQMPARKELSRHLAWQRCYDAALDGAVAQVDAPQLLALHRAESGARHG